MSKKSVPEANSTSDNDDDDDEDDNDNEDDLSSEKEYYRIRDEVLNEISLKHPITYDSYNICDMAATSKLSKFSIAMLQEICRYFELDISSVKQKRKKPYVARFVSELSPIMYVQFTNLASSGILFSTISSYFREPKLMICLVNV